MSATPDPRTDAQLITAINRGDERAFAVLYERHRDYILRLAMRFTNHSDDALDVLQETFRYLLSKTPHLTLTASLMTFLYPAVKHLGIAARRKRGRFAGPGPDAPDPAAPAVAGVPDFGPLLACLSEPQAEVILLRFVDDLSLEEIAVALGIPLGTVKSRLHNAIGALRADPRTKEFFEES